MAEAPFSRLQKGSENFIGRTPNALREFGIGDFIALQGTACQSLYLLYSGRVRTNMVNEEGKQVTIEEIEAPRLLAPAFIFATDNRFPVNITTLTNCEVLVLNRTDFVDLMHREKVVMQNFLRIISDRSIFLSRKLNAFALQDLKTRLLAYLHEHENPRSRQEIADILGVARPSLARVLSELADEGYLRIEKRKITVVQHKID
ncbi:MAG: Crp/Fnr family transcriptional regulator [Odoribacter splanchnicus]